MTNVELDAHVDMMPAIRAERMLDAAQVAIYPFHAERTPEHAKSWWERLLSDARSTFRQVAKQQRTSRSLFSLNGVAVGFQELRAKLGSALGGGLQG